MPGRYEFSLPDRPSRDGWFRLGTVDVTTTTLLVGLGVLSMFLYAIDPGAAFKGAFASPLVKDGEIWRLVTWPLVNPPTEIWVVLTLAFFWFVGHQIEDRVGRRPYAVLIAAMTIIPAVLVTAIGTRNDAMAMGRWSAFAFGLGLLAIGLLVVFALDNPGARFFFGIPAWAIAAVYVAIDVLRLTGSRLWAQLVLECLVIAVACVGARQLGMVETLSFIPQVAGGPKPSRSRPARSAGRSGGKGRKPARGRPSQGSTVVAGPWGNSGHTPLEQAELDVLLDKISESGIDSLNTAERQRLQILSKRLRG